MIMYNLFPLTSSWKGGQNKNALLREAFIGSKNTNESKKVINKNIERVIAFKGEGSKITTRYTGTSLEPSMYYLLAQLVVKLPSL